MAASAVARRVRRLPAVAPAVAARRLGGRARARGPPGRLRAATSSEQPSAEAGAGAGAASAAPGSCRGSGLVGTLEEAARLAALSSQCYALEEAGGLDGVKRFLAEAGLVFRAWGSSKSTRWYVADAVDAGADERGGAVLRRHVLLRGVKWRDAGMDRVGLGLLAGNAWPRDFPCGLGERGLKAHSGFLTVAEEIWPVVKPLVTDPAVGPRAELVFAGHSMGGTLGLLLCLLARAEGGRAPGGLRTVAFGSPPALTSTAADGAAALELGGLDPANVQTFVLDRDPVPRSLLAAGPTYRAALRVAGVKPLLAARQFLFQDSLLSPGGEKFLYDFEGSVFFVKWVQARGYRVTELAEGSAAREEAMRLDLEDISGGLGNAFQAVTDHSHWNYSAEIAAAVALLKKEGAG